MLLQPSPSQTKQSAVESSLFEQTFKLLKSLEQPRTGSPLAGKSVVNCVTAKNVILTVRPDIARRPAIDNIRFSLDNETVNTGALMTLCAFALAVLVAVYTRTLFAVQIVWVIAEISR